MHEMETMLVDVIHCSRYEKRKKERKKDVATLLCCHSVLSVFCDVVRIVR